MTEIFAKGAGGCVKDGSRMAETALGLGSSWNLPEIVRFRNGPLDATRAARK